MNSRVDAVVVGAGPNGLTAAARLARAGRSVLVLEASPTIGGGSRTIALGEARIDHCAAVHPFGATSPAFEALDLTDHGLQWLRPPIGLAHPFDDGGVAMVDDDTAAGLGTDEARWRRIIDPFADDWHRWRHAVVGPVLRAVVEHPVAMTRFGLFAGLPATVFERLFRERSARALIAGSAAHGGAALTSLTTAGVGLGLLAAGQASGMPVAAGGSQAIVDALAAVVLAHGGTIETGRRVSTWSDLPTARSVLFDLTPGQAAAIVGSPPPRWRHGVAAWKLDLVLSGPMPWTAAACGRAGTVHLGGTAHEIAVAERATARGGLPDRPFVIVAQPSVVDPSRAPAGQHVVWAYRHVPNGCTDDRATAGIEAQFDRFAPGWRDLVVDRRVTTATGYAAYSESYVGGDIAGGAMTPWQTIARPRLAYDPYPFRGRDGVWLCSQSTPPGPGVHGMCGWHAAGSVLAAR
ncbi:MAG: NAD(P)/FAD-dependent oxidoreductase [Ilumatobacteraceae bacterium]